MKTLRVQKEEEEEFSIQKVTNSCSSKKDLDGWMDGWMDIERNFIENERWGYRERKIPVIFDEVFAGRMSLHVP